MSEYKYGLCLVDSEEEEEEEENFTALRLQFRNLAREVSQGDLSS